MIKWIDEDLVELFNLENDPGEQFNLAEKEPNRATEMLAQIATLEDEVGNMREPGKKALDRRLERLKNKMKDSKAGAGRKSSGQKQLDPASSR